MEEILQTWIGLQGVESSQKKVLKVSREYSISKNPMWKSLKDSDMEVHDIQVFNFHWLLNDTRSLLHKFFLKNGIQTVSPIKKFPPLV